MAYAYQQAPTVAQQIANYPGSQSSFNAYQPQATKDEEEKSPYLPKYPQNFREYISNVTKGPLEQVPQTRAGTATPQQQAQAQQQQAPQPQGAKPPSVASTAGQAVGVGGGIWAANQLFPAGQIATPVMVGATRLPGAIPATTATPGMLMTDPGIATPKIIGASVVPEAVSPYTTWSGTGEALVGSESAGMAAGAITAAAGAYIAIHQAPKMIDAMQEGNMTGAGAHGLATGAGAGAAVGATIAGPAGAAIGAAIGAVVGGLGGLVGASHTGKDHDQLKRDAIRDAMQDIKLIDDNYNLTLADGTKYDIGKDGHAKNFDGSGYAYQVARENPFSVQAVAWADALTYTMMGQSKKLATDFTGYFANAAMSNAQDIETVRMNMLTFINQAGLTRQQMEEVLKRRLDEGQIDEQTFKAMLGSIATLFDGRDYVVMSWKDAEDKFSPGVATDQNPAAVPAPHPEAPEKQEGFVINGLDPQQMPADMVLRMNNLYNYYGSRRTAQANAQTAPVAREIVNYNPQTPLSEIEGTIGTMNPISRGPNLALLRPGQSQEAQAAETPATPNNPNLPEGIQGW